MILDSNSVIIGVVFYYTPVPDSGFIVILGKYKGMFSVISDVTSDVCVVTVVHVPLGHWHWPHCNGSNVVTRSYIYLLYY